MDCKWRMCQEKASKGRHLCDWHQMIYNKRRRDEENNLELDALLLDGYVDQPEEEVYGSG